MQSPNKKSFAIGESVQIMSEQFRHMKGTIHSVVGKGMLYTVRLTTGALCGHFRFQELETHQPNQA